MKSSHDLFARPEVCCKATLYLLFCVLWLNRFSRPVLRLGSQSLLTLAIKLAVENRLSHISCMPMTSLSLPTGQKTLWSILWLFYPVMRGLRGSWSIRIRADFIFMTSFSDVHLLLLEWLVFLGISFRSLISEFWFFMADLSPFILNSLWIKSDMHLRDGRRGCYLLEDALL